MVEDTPRTFSAADLLWNDSDPDKAGGDILSFHSVAGAVNGVAVLNADGTITFTPAANYNGPASFTYKVKDTAGAVSANSATVSLTITAVNDAVVARNDTASTIEDSAILTSVVLANDVAQNPDGPGEALSVTTTGDIATSGGGRVVMAANGNYTYHPATDFIGIDTFTYTVTDGATSAVGTVAVTVTAKNDATDTPIGAVYDTATTVSNTSVSGNVLTNDRADNPDGPSETLSVITTPTKSSWNGGTVTLNANGDYVYTPAAGFTGTDYFDYIVTDANSTAVGYVTITVSNANPIVAQNDSATSLDGAAIQINILGNERAQNPDGPSESLSVNFDTPANGYLFNWDGTSIWYQPNSGFSGTEMFGYTVSDGTTNSLGAVTVTVGIEDGVVAVNDTLAVYEDNSGTVNVLTNDRASNPDGSAEHIYVYDYTQPSHGNIVSFDGSGGFTYAPNADFVGTDTFTYTVNDGTSTAIGTVTITITAVPNNTAVVARHDAITVLSNQYTPPFNVLTNDRGQNPDGVNEVLTVTGYTYPSNGTLYWNGNGEFTYLSYVNFAGTDNFTYTVSDGTSTSVGTVTLTVLANSGVLAIADTNTVIEDGGYITGNVLINDRAQNPDGPAEELSIQYYNGTTAAGGYVYISTDGTYNYAPAVDFNGTDSFTYTVTDGTNSAVGTVSITVTAVEDVPHLISDEYETVKTNPVVGNVLTNDRAQNPDGPSEPLSVISTGHIVTAYGGVVVMNSNGDFTYTAAVGFWGNDYFNYTVTDGTHAVSGQYVHIIVRDIVARDDNYTIAEDTPLTGNVLTNDSAQNPDGPAEPLTASSYWTTSYRGGAITFNTDGSFTYTPPQDFNGDDWFDYQVNDGVSSDAGRVMITVTAVNDALELVVDKTSATGSEPVFYNASIAHADPGEIVAYSVTTMPLKGSVSQGGSGSFYYTPDPVLFNNTAGTDSFVITVSDGNGDSDSQTLTYHFVPSATLTLSGTAHDIAASDDATRTFVLLASSNEVQVVDTSGASPTSMGVVSVGDTPTAIAASANGSRAYIANSASNSVSIVDASGPSLVVTTVNVGSNPTAVGVSADGTRAYVVNSGSNTVSIINWTGTTPTVAHVNVGISPFDVEVSADGTRAFVSNYDSNTVSIIDASGSTPVVTHVAVGDGPREIKVSDNGAVAIVYNSNHTDQAFSGAEAIMPGSVSIIRFAGATPTVSEVAGPFYSHTKDGFIAISDDGTRAFVTSHRLSNSLGIIDTTGSSPTVSFVNLPDYAHSVSTNSNGSYAYVVGDQPGVLVVNSATSGVTYVNGAGTHATSNYEQVVASNDGFRVVMTDLGSNLTVRTFTAPVV
ncbi:Ig-like domain-containing protein [Mycolicibacterium sp. BiH015]|uniref:Ig-like domain-containing protein n=1 Tax=Mycolicibacterium sp. BiH015 TaxID=3018808 RepID=UPI0022E84CC0|nr:Ig-like domain-containing protein [Mycolicibacterium sp. BiH015]MDA2895459.1 Ig-like domain-containing protein [Mycolicibacterium sp. BiH015]